MANILFFCDKNIGDNMAGPGMRTWEVANVLSDKNTVDIIALDRKKSPFRLMLKSEIVIFPIYYLKLFWLLLAKILRKKIIIDAYYFPYFEMLEKFPGVSIQSAMLAKLSLLRTKILLKSADLIICSSERQKSMWLGLITSFGRVNPKLYSSDKSLSGLLRIVPMGIRSKPPVKTDGLLRNRIKGITSDDIIVLWFSGIWPWLDPISAIRAIDSIMNNNVKLVFFGTNALDSHFKDGSSSALDAAVTLSKNLNLFNKRVFFIPDRINYDQIENILLDSNISISLHHNNLETQYACRGRILEYIWANIPIIATKGDVLADEISSNKLGIVVDYSDEKGIAQAIIKLAEDKKFYNECKENMACYAAKMHWNTHCLPLKQYCDLPSYASDNKTILDLVFICFNIIYLYLLGLIILVLRIIRRQNESIS